MGATIRMDVEAGQRWLYAHSQGRVRAMTAFPRGACLCRSRPPLRSTQIWRLVTNFFIVSKPSFKLVIYCMWVVSYVVSAAVSSLRWGQEVEGWLGAWHGVVSCVEYTGL